jgi:hypothetical protein
LDYFNHIMKRNEKFSRRDFLRFSALTLGSIAFSRNKIGKTYNNYKRVFQNLADSPKFDENVLYGRMCIGEPGTSVPIKSEPYIDAPEVGKAWFDEVFRWKREVIPNENNLYIYHQEVQRWVETEKGYIHSENLQKVRHIIQEPILELPENSSGERGMWVEIVTPYTDLELTKQKSSYQYWISDILIPRIYYSQIFWAFDVRQNSSTGKIQYRLKQLHGAFADDYWVDATVCRHVLPDEISPIHPNAENKKAVVNLTYQTMSCYEDDVEVFFTKVSTGGKIKDGEWITPAVTQPIWRKSLSIHMSEGNAAVGAYDLPGIAWTTFINNNGVAVHSTYWHNSFGNAKSHGCVNVKPEDAKWFWRWTEPVVPYYPGDWQAYQGGKSTIVEVVEA